MAGFLYLPHIIPLLLTIPIRAVAQKDIVHIDRGGYYDFVLCLWAIKWEKTSYYFHISQASFHQPASPRWQTNSLLIAAPVGRLWWEQGQQLVPGDYTRSCCSLAVPDYVKGRLRECGVSVGKCILCPWPWRVLREHFINTDRCKNAIPVQHQILSLPLSLCVCPTPCNDRWNSVCWSVTVTNVLLGEGSLPHSFGPIMSSLWSAICFDAHTYNISPSHRTGLVARQSTTLRN